MAGSLSSKQRWSSFNGLGHNMPKDFVPIIFDLFVLQVLRFTLYTKQMTRNVINLNCKRCLRSESRLVENATFCTNSRSWKKMSNARTTRATTKQDWAIAVTLEQILRGYFGATGVSTCWLAGHSSRRCERGRC